MWYLNGPVLYSVRGSDLGKLGLVKMIQSKQIKHIVTTVMCCLPGTCSLSYDECPSPRVCVVWGTGDSYHLPSVIICHWRSWGEPDPGGPIPCLPVKPYTKSITTHGFKSSTIRSVEAAVCVCVYVGGGVVIEPLNPSYFLNLVLMCSLILWALHISPVCSVSV